MTTGPDPRITPWRSDIAAAHLEGQVEAERFVEGRTMQVTATSAPLRAAPRGDARMVTEALHGERMTVYEDRDGWVWGQLESDGYVGYAERAGLGEDLLEPTHRVAVPRTFLFPEPDIKSVPIGPLSLNSQIRVDGPEGDFMAVVPRGFIYARHLVPLGQFAADPVAVAESLLGAPYLWGGKQSTGLDCSGLIQVSLTAAGIACPRDSDMQERELGTPVDPGDLSRLQRGDLVFWRGHVGIMANDRDLIHSNAYHLLTAREPLAEPIARAAGHSPVTAIRRLAQ